MADVPVWRQALKDNQHKFHKAAWIIFSEEMKADFAAVELRDQSEELIPFLLTILDTPELYLEGSLGDGYAPANAATLLGKWQVTAAIPRLIDILREDDGDSIVVNNATLALEAMGEPAFEPMWEFVQSLPKKEQNNYALTLAELGKKDPRVWNFIKSNLDKAKHELDIRWFAEGLMMCDLEPAIELLQTYIKQGRYKGDVRTVLEKWIADARAKQTQQPQQSS